MGLYEFYSLQIKYLGDFLLYYSAKLKSDPANYPATFTAEEWAEQLAAFIEMIHD